MRFRLYFIREVAMDVLDQLLADLRQESCVFCRLDATEPWRIQKLKCCRTVLRSAFRQGRIETANNAHDLCEETSWCCQENLMSLPVPAPRYLSLLAERASSHGGRWLSKNSPLQHGGGGST